MCEILQSNLKQTNKHLLQLSVKICFRSIKIEYISKSNKYYLLSLIIIKLKYFWYCLIFIKSKNKEMVKLNDIISEKKKQLKNKIE